MLDCWEIIEKWNKIVVLSGFSSKSGVLISSSFCWYNDMGLQCYDKSNSFSFAKWVKMNFWVVDFLVASDGSRAGSERRRSSGVYASSNHSTHVREPGRAQFTMEDILKATRNFSPSFKIGQGGFGTVYKGRLEDGTVVAVKRAKKVWSKLFRMDSILWAWQLSDISGFNHLFFGYISLFAECIW